MKYLIFDKNEFDFKETDDEKAFKLAKKLNQIDGIPNVIALNKFDYKNIEDKKGYIKRFSKARIKSYIKVETVFEKKVVTLAVFLSNYDNIMPLILSDFIYQSGRYPLDYLLNILSNDQCFIYITDIHKIKFDNRRYKSIIDFVEKIIENSDNIHGIEVKGEYSKNLKEHLEVSVDFNAIPVCYELNYVDLFKNNEDII